VRTRGAVGLVTGGASGLGEGVVRMLAAAGGSAAILDLPSSRGAEIGRELGDAVAFFPADVTNDAEVVAAVAAAASHFGRLDLCVNAAGISVAARVVARDETLYPMDLFRRIVDINLVGTFTVARHAALHMSRNEPGADGERGLIVNVGSIAAFEGQLGQTGYAASKGAIVALTLPMARELSTRGIRVLTVCPGVMDTPMVAGTTDKVRAALQETPLFPRRLGTPADFADLVRALMENILLNAEVIRLDAGTRLAGR